MDIIVDIDGTLADCTHRLHHIQKQPKDWDAFFAATAGDTPILPVLEIVDGLARMEHRIIFCSGRPERTREATEKWLFLMLDYASIDRLYMRPDDNHSDDDTLKRWLLEKIRADGFNPVLAIEDRKRVVEMWRSEGLICAQVAEGDF